MYKLTKSNVCQYISLGKAALNSLLLMSLMSCNPKPKPSKGLIYLLPDNTVIQVDKLDSLEKAWGKNRVRIRVDAGDDDLGLVHLVRLTDEMSKIENEDSIQEEKLKDMLNKPAPDFSLPGLKNKLISLSGLRGKVIAVNFWFTSCPQCIKEMPELNEVVKKYRGRDVAFLAVTFNNEKQVQQFSKEFKFDYQLLINGEGVTDNYGIKSFPVHLVIDKKGIIRRVFNSGDNIGIKLSHEIDRYL